MYIIAYILTILLLDTTFSYAKPCRESSAFIVMPHHKCGKRIKRIDIKREIIILKPDKKAKK